MITRSNSSLHRRGATLAVRAVVATIAIIAGGASLAASSYPSQPVTLVVPYPAGAAVDRIGRSLAHVLGSELGQTVVVENVGGASGTIGARKVTRAAPDGYTLLLGTVNETLVGPAMMSAGYGLADFTPITRLSNNSTVLVAHPSFPASSVDELVAQAKQAQQPLLIGSTGNAMMQTLGGSMLANVAGISFEEVPYKGGSPLLNDLIGGQVGFGTISLPSALNLIRSGQLKALGVVSQERSPTAPEIPTINEGSAIKGVSADLWTGVFGPANLPPEVVEKVSAAMAKVMQDPRFQESEFQAGSPVVAFESPAVFREFLAQEEARVMPVIELAKGGSNAAR